MVDPNTRQGKRTPVTLKIKFKSETLEQFIERYAVDVSQGGIFIRTKEPLAVGTQMRFEFQLRDASPLIAGEGTVVWTRENDPSRPAIAPGMGVRFDRLAEGSQTVLERILSEKAKQAPQRTHESSTKPPLFTDTPTKVAPLPVQEALLDGKPKRNTKDFGDQHTPLPKPMPFHSDAEDFDEQAFEEATKVRALDELIAQTAEGGASEPGGATAIIPPDELAARRVAAGGRADSTLADAPTFTKPASEGSIGVAKASAPDRDSAPGLPSPPAAGTSPRLLDATPSPRAVEVPPDALAKTKLGFEAPRTGAPSSPPRNKMATPAPGVVAQAVSAAASTSSAIKDAQTRPSGMQAVATEPSGPTKRPAAAPQKSSAVPIAILILVLLAAGAAGVWFFVIRPKQQAENEAANPGSGSVVKTPTPPTPGSGSQVASNPPPTPGSGSQKAGSNAETPPVPKGPVVDTVIASSVDKSTVEIVGTDQQGPAPFTAKLEKDKTYKARITAPGFAATEIDIKGGDAKQTAKLVAKPRFVAVNTEPTGALIFVDGSATGHTTPHEVELTKAQAAKKSVRITMRKAGFRQVDKSVAVADYKEEDSKLLASIEEKLTQQQQVVRPPPPDRGSGAVKPPDTGAGSGSATPPDPGTGSQTPPNPGNGSSTPTPPTPSGGSATTPPAGTGSAKPATTPTTPTTPPAGAGSAKPATPTTTPPAGAGSQASKSPSEPEPDFVKK